MINPDRLYLLCKDVLTAVETYYTTAAVDLPSRRYVANGDQQVAFDGEQVTVAHQRTNSQAGDVTQLATSAFRRDPAHTMRAATIGVTLVRCAPKMRGGGVGQVPSPPSVEDEEASARLIYADQQMIENAILAAQKAALLGSCNSVGFVDAVTLGTQGLFCSTAVRLILGLE